MENKIEILYTENQIQERLKELAKQLDKDYQGKDLTVLCVMRGALIFAVELTLKMKTLVKFEFIEISSYGADTCSSGNIDLRTDIRDDITGKDILIIEDIVDTGRSMVYLLNHLKSKGANSIKICVLADRKDRREFDVSVDYAAFQIPNKYVVGFGFDVGEKYRNLPYIGTIE